MLEISKSTLFDPIKSLKGIGPKTLQLFEKLCGTKIIDLLSNLMINVILNLEVRLMAWSPLYFPLNRWSLSER